MWAVVSADSFGDIAETMMSTFGEVTIRAPWPDEIARLQYFLPPAFLFDTDPFLLVAVAGRVQRFVAALSMTTRPLKKANAAWLCMRVENQDSLSAELVRRGVAEAWALGAQSVYFGQTIDEESEAARALGIMGFEPVSIHEVYELDSRKLWERLERIRQRMVASNLIPLDVRLTTLQPSMLPKVRRFLMAHLPESVSVMALETGGYKAEHSIALAQENEIKGVLLCRRAGPVVHVGLRVVAKELRGGLGWANLMLLHASISSGVQTGLEITRFEFDPLSHEDTKQFAALNDARLIGRRLLLRIIRSKENS